MNTSSFTAGPLTESTALSAEPEPTGDPAGNITLFGRNKANARARVLSGLLLTSGLIVALGSTDTTSSMYHGI